MLEHMQEQATFFPGNMHAHKCARSHIHSGRRGNGNPGRRSEGGHMCPSITGQIAPGG